MSELLGQLGIDWKLLLSQGVNFFILLIVLTLFVWRPLIALVKRRQAAIGQGLDDAHQASLRLAQADEEASVRLAHADAEAVALITKAELEAGVRAERITARTEEKVNFMLKEAEVILQQKKQEELEDVLRVAQDLIKDAIVETVKLKPSAVDDALIGEALRVTKKKHA